MEELFDLNPYHVLMAGLGAAVLLAYWLPRLLFRQETSSSMLLMLFGLLVYAFVPGMPTALQPTEAPRIWEVLSEFVVIVVLFATGLRIDGIRGYGLWRPTIRLLAVVMPLTIAAVALLGWSLAGMTLAGAVLLGAVLAPTDPVLAGDVQVGPPLEGGEHPVRFALTTEAGLNDGLAFPFVYLGLLLAVEGAGPGDVLVEWLVRDVLYRTAVGAVLGAAVGWLLGRILFVVPRWNRLAETGPGVVALAGTLVCYGVVELAEGYGFIAVFVAGVVCRNTESQHEFHRRLHGFSESIEQAVTAVLLVLLGSALPELWPYLDWRHSVIGFGLLLVIRPIAGWIGLAGAGLTRQERAVVAFYGVRGIGSIYYVGYATGHIEFVNENQIWALVAFTIFASTMIHGLTARVVVDRVVKLDPR
ncbi:MAG TPA: cation:proton antiporter [Thermohalobaculum sp.]|nr:cation:proton antiporter [Thermohalobaculum sp.]